MQYQITTIRKCTIQCNTK